MATRSSSASSSPPASASKNSKTTPPSAAVAPASSTAANAALKLRQTQAEYVAARPAGEPGVKPMMSSSKMYVCRRCQANFKTGDGKPDSRLPGLGKCNKCLAAAAASALAA
jgi:predicted RNA-binding Zn ribbon-like protein